MVPQLLILHLYPDWPEAESESLQEKVQHVGAGGQIAKVYEEVFGEAIWIFVVFWSDLVAQLDVEDVGFTTVGSSSGSVTGSGMIIGCTCSS